MIRLIATDLDGTLLNSSKELPVDFFDTVKALRRRGIHFAISSGRQYYNLLKLFGPIRDNLIFICENGSMIFEQGENCFVSEIAPEKLRAPLDVVRRIPTAFPICCGVKSAYVEDRDPEFLRNASMYYERIEVVPDLLALAGIDRICKIAVFDRENAGTNCEPLCAPFRDRLMVTLAGANWLDFMNQEVNKGLAMRKLQERYQLTQQECMAFGDYMNDYEMMQECHFSYAMANALPELKAVCNYTAPSNDEDGVMAVLRSTFALA